ncbi:MAG: hypothetical protein HON53_03170 [Planctomycetaceae bacterium]|nr:hypothetical protein [Planctomycetaceae bacterium]
MAAPVVLLLVLAGCEGGPASSFSGLRSTSGTSPDEKTEMEYRSEYQAERDPEALGWLLANRIRQGMGVGEVNEILGQDGTREFDDRKLKAGNPAYRADDIAYRWGPDSGGRAVYLLFREDKLLNFDPQQFVDE